jgi:hypothetical protein
MSYLAGPSAVNLDLEERAPANDVRDDDQRRTNAEGNDPLPGGPPGTISCVDLDLT